MKKMKKIKKIKILYTIPNFDTAGSGKALLNLALGLDKEKFEAEILCLHSKGAFFETVKNSGIPVHIFDYLPKERPIWKMFLECWKVSRKFKAIHPDIIHSFHYSSNYTEALSAKLAGIKWTFTKKNMSWGGSSKNSWKLRSFFANKIIVQNTDMIQEFYPTSKKLSFIPRGVVIEKFKKDIPKSEIRSLMETDKDKRILIAVANLVPVKNIELLIHAFKNIHEDFQNWMLWIIGDTNSEYGKKMMDLVAENQLESKIKFSGKQLNVVDYLNHAEIFILPTSSKGEGSPVALLEAMANEKVVLGAEVPGIKDQLFGKEAHLFHPNNVDELANKLQFFMCNSIEENNQIGKEFSQFATENYSIQTEIEKHEKHYLELM